VYRGNERRRAGLVPGCSKLYGALPVAIVNDERAIA
jgi:hypothetical protein